MDIENQASSFHNNFPYVAVSVGDISCEFLVICERIPLIKSSNLVTIVNCLIATYFTFNIEYPASLKSIMIFTQHVLLGITDEQPVPNTVLQLRSSNTGQTVNNKSSASSSMICLVIIIKISLSFSFNFSVTTHMYCQTLHYNYLI